MRAVRESSGPVNQLAAAIAATRPGSRAKAALRLETISEDMLYQLEKGKKKPTRAEIQELDDAWELHGNLLRIYFLDDLPRQLSQMVASDTFTDTFPDDWVGTVWVCVSPEEPGVHAVTIHWPPFRKQVSIDIHGPTFLSFGKSNCGSHALPVTVDVYPNAKVVFGQGVPGEPKADINADHLGTWDITMINGELVPMIQNAIRQHLTRSGRSYHDVADFTYLSLDRIIEALGPE
jgi:hypothetical protein